MSKLVEFLENFAPKIILSLILISLISPSDSVNPSISCRGRKDGKYADSKDCYHFLQCFGGIQFTSKCPRGHVFDKYSMKCETSVDIPCNATKTQKSLVGTRCKVEGEIKPSVVFCERFLVCRNGLNYPIYCPPGLIFSNKAYACILAPDPCATDAVSKNKQKQNELMKREKSPYITICDNKIGQNITEPLHCTLYIQCMTNQLKNTTIIYISACGLGLLFSRETAQCEKPDVVLCGTRYRNTKMFGADPKPQVIFEFLAKRNKANAIDPHEDTTTAEPETTSLTQNFGRGMLGGPGDWNTDGHGVGKLDNQKGHRTVIHDFGSKTNDSSESFLVKIILNKNRYYETTSILGRNGTHNHFVIEEASGEIPAVAAGSSLSKTEGGNTNPSPAVAVVPIPKPPAEKVVATTEGDYYDDEITTLPVHLSGNPPTTPKPAQKVLGIGKPADEEEYDDDTTVMPNNDANKMKVPVNATNPGNSTAGQDIVTENLEKVPTTTVVAPWEWGTLSPQIQDYDDSDYYYDEADKDDLISDDVESRNGNRSQAKVVRTLPPKKIKPEA